MQPIFVSLTTPGLNPPYGLAIWFNGNPCARTMIAVSRTRAIVFDLEDVMVMVPYIGYGKHWKTFCACKLTNVWDMQYPLCTFISI